MITVCKGYQVIRFFLRKGFIITKDDNLPEYTIYEVAQRWIASGTVLGNHARTDRDKLSSTDGGRKAKFYGNCRWNHRVYDSNPCPHLTRE